MAKPRQFEPTMVELSSQRRPRSTPPPKRGPKIKEKRKSPSKTKVSKRAYLPERKKLDKMRVQLRKPAGKRTGIAELGGWAQQMLSMLSKRRRFRYFRPVAGQDYLFLWGNCVGWLRGTCVSVRTTRKTKKDDKKQRLIDPFVCRLLGEDGQIFVVPSAQVKRA